jgi:hypothetical protein
VQLTARTGALLFIGQSYHPLRLDSIRKPNEWERSGARPDIAKIGWRRDVASRWKQQGSWTISMLFRASAIMLARIEVSSCSHNADPVAKCLREGAIVSHSADATQQGFNRHLHSTSSSPRVVPVRTKSGLHRQPTTCRCTEGTVLRKL